MGKDEWRDGLEVGPDEISVWVGNLGRYNEGCLQGGWITLPVEPAELDRFFREVVGLETDSHKAYEAGLRGERVYEEYFVADYEFAGLLKELSYRPHEYVMLEDLNLLAGVAFTQCWDHEAVSCATDYDVVADDPLELANLIAQSDEIPFYRYYFDGIEWCENDSPEEKYGRMIAEAEGLTELLEARGAADYFDFERYGECMGQDYHLTDEGYLDCTQDLPDLDHYDREELMELAGWDVEEPEEDLSDDGERNPSLEALSPVRLDEGPDHGEDREAER